MISNQCPIELFTLSYTNGTRMLGMWTGIKWWKHQRRDQPREVGDFERNGRKNQQASESPGSGGLDAPRGSPFVARTPLSIELASEAAQSKAAPF